jgi:hypothetical protein
MLTESVTLSAAGTLMGIAFARWGSHALSEFIIGQVFIIPATVNLSPDLRVLGFTSGVAICTGVLFGLAPAWHASREDPNSALQQSTRTLGGGASRLGKGLIVAQVALSLVLLVAAGLFIRTLEKLHAVDPGFRTRSVLDVSLFPRPAGYKNLAWVSYHRELTDRISRLRGVESVGIAHMSPGNLNEWTERMRVAGTSGQGYTSNFVMLMPGAFQTLHMAVLGGAVFPGRTTSMRPAWRWSARSLLKKFFPPGTPSDNISMF